MFTDELDELISPEGLAKLCSVTASGQRFIQECLMNPDGQVIICANGKAVIKFRGVLMRERLHRKGK